MQKLIIFAILLVALAQADLSTDLDQYLGNYVVGSQCSSISCPRTYYGNYDYCCPLSGQDGYIGYNQDQNSYFISFKTYNEFGPNGFFQAPFTPANFYKDPTTDWERVRIVMNDGYVLNILPCYQGEATFDLCSNIGPTELVVYKTDGSQKEIRACTFTMQWFSNKGSEEFDEDLDEEFFM